jgi:hypothetical protein
MIHAARQAQAAEIQVIGNPVGRDDVADLLDRALDAGLDRVELIIELADLCARFYTLCSPAAIEPIAAIGSEITTETAVSV